MAIVQLATRTDLTSYTMRVDLEGRTYVFIFELNSRDGYWYMDVQDADGVAIRSGVRLVLGASYLRLMRDERAPPGVLASIDTTGAGLEAGEKNLGERVLLLYAEQADVEAAAA